eukprot:TRINITY_DN22619_c0_g1_i1.p1 TRINITY_DN22619_c0_g1~~TRINITY_DN22619_c0_g1_i1.p1  ORF type:complete len:395 (+),score=31.13 TRINITY_DN22619_c0_g1_i1:34-1218(+)
MESAVVILGGEGSGKTALVLRYVQGTYTDIYDPHIVEEYKTQDTVDGVTMLLKISDVSGCAEYRDVRDAECRKADGYMYVIDACSASSLQAVKAIREAVTGEIGDKPSVLVASKCDSDDLDVLEESRSLAAAWQVPLIECSSKLSFGVSEAFHHIARLLNPSLSQGLRRNWDESFIITTDKSDKEEESDAMSVHAPCEDVSLLLSSPSPSPQRAEAAEAPMNASSSTEDTPTSKSLTNVHTTTSLQSRMKPNHEPEPLTVPDFFGFDTASRFTEAPKGTDREGLCQPLLGSQRFHTDEQVNFAQPSNETSLLTKSHRRRSMSMAPLALGPAASLPPLVTNRADRELMVHEVPRTPMSQHLQQVDSFDIQSKEDGKRVKRRWYHKLCFCCFRHKH